MKFFVADSILIFSSAGLTDKLLSATKICLRFTSYRTISGLFFLTDADRAEFQFYAYTFIVANHRLCDIDREIVYIQKSKQKLKCVYSKHHEFCCEDAHTSIASSWMYVYSTNFNPKALNLILKQFMYDLKLK